MFQDHGDLFITALVEKYRQGLHLMTVSQCNTSVILLGIRAIIQVVIKHEQLKTQG